MTNMETVKFRLIVFRPFKGEILLGKIASATEHGIKSRPIELARLEKCSSLTRIKLVSSFSTTYSSPRIFC